jgi:hypothetical protein
MWRPGKLRFLIGVKNPLPIRPAVTARKHGPLQGRAVPHPDRRALLILFAAQKETPEGYEALYRLITNQPRVRMPELGTLLRLPERPRKWTGEPPQQAEDQEDQIRITSPLAGGLLGGKEREPCHEGFTYVVRGTLKHLPTNHCIWLLNVYALSDEVWPQIFGVKYFPQQGEWEGRIYLPKYQESVIIVAVVAPPTSQELFSFYAQSLSERKDNLPIRPLTRIPAEITNFARIHARAPQG